jgi:hypothetical protein
LTSGIMIDQSGRPALDLAVQFLDRYRRPLASVAGALTIAAETLVHPTIILPLIVAAVDGPATAAGTLTAAAASAWLLPQLLVGRADWRGWLLAARAALAAAFGFLVMLLAGSPGGLLSTLLIVVAAFWAAGGLLAAGGSEGLLGEPDTEGAPLDLSLLLGGGLAVLGGLLAGRLLGPDGAGFPGWAAQLAVLAALALAAAAGLSWRGGPTADPAAAPPWRRLALVPALLAYGRRPRRYVVFRILLGAAMLADPLLILIGLRRFDLPIQAVGLVLALTALVYLIAGLTLPAVVNAGFSRLLAQAAALIRLLLPLLALALPMILRSGPVATRLPAEATWLGPTAFGGLAVLWAAAMAATAATDAAYLRDALAPAHRGAMRAMLLLLLALLSLAFVAGGIIADRWGLDTLLMIACGAGLLTVLASGLLLEVPPADTRDLTDTGALPTFREQEDWA